MPRTIYLFDPETRVLVGSSPLPLDPVETERAGKPVYARINAAIATDAVPPTVPDGMRAVLLDRTWVLEPTPQPTASLAPADIAPTAAAEPHSPAPPDRIDALRTLVQAYLDAMARSLGYDDIRTAATYADEPAVARFQNEGGALRAWRSLVWEAFEEIADRVKAGAAEEPSAETIADLLPRLSIPPLDPAPAPTASVDLTGAAAQPPALAGIDVHTTDARSAKTPAQPTRRARSAKAAAAPDP